MLEIFEVVKSFFAVEELDVLRLSWRELPHCPGEMHEVRLEWSVHRVHSDFARQAVRLAGVAGAAGGDDVGPVVGSAAGDRDEVIARERFARLELDLQSAAILTAIPVAREEECVGDLSAEAAGHVDEARKPDDHGARQCQSLGADYPFGICFDDFGFPINDQPQRSPERHHRKRLERSVQCKTTYDQAPPSLLASLQYTPQY